MTLSSEPRFVGPAEPESPIGDRVPVLVNDMGSLVRQEYSDGTVYDLEVPKGGDFDPTFMTLIPMGAKWYVVYDPADGPFPDFESEVYHLSWWVSNNN